MLDKPVPSGLVAERTPGRWLAYAIYAMAIFTVALGNMLNASLFGWSSLVMGTTIALAGVWYHRSLVPESFDRQARLRPKVSQEQSTLRRAS